ncbi:YigZ family protein [Prevotella sp. A2931]|uniref:YigZ family protein n=1 Tax=Prevotella illustrans TaxID=2800387 RepID=A0ABS3M2M6_9BACT|nr:MULTISPECIES: YigZ family protein [Prevotella]MBO1362391.1 YigZ family protein [Prevotella illustrans]PTL25091.1 YigZ family protein [Prevotella sp. oral taxon 820]
MTDEYKTITGDKIGEGSYTESKSRFLAFAHHVDNIDDIKSLLNQYKKTYYDARHICYAYMLGNERIVFRANDDGEPNNTAGKPLLGQINSKELTDILIVVVRYYGGIKLGTSRLTVAYRTAAALAIENSIIEVLQVKKNFTFSFPYEKTKEVMKILKEISPEILHQNFEQECSMTVAVRLRDAVLLETMIKKIL